jgi:hypothetical protein
MRPAVAFLSAVLAAAAATTTAGCALDPAGAGMPRSATAVATATVLAATPWSGYTSPERRVIAAPADWAAAWSQIHAGRTPVPALPAVDFSRDVVILAAMGTRRSTGFSIVIDEVRVLAGTFYVRVTETSPGRNCAVGAAITAPVHAVRAPREAVSARFVVTRLETRC